MEYLKSAIFSCKCSAAYVACGRVRKVKVAQEDFPFPFWTETFVGTMKIKEGTFCLGGIACDFS